MPHVTLPTEPGVEIYYEWFQPFDREKPTALVLPPAISCSALILQHVLPQLDEVTRSFNCLSLDLRGHGRTKCPLVKGYDSFVFATDIAFVLNALGIPSIHLVANSYTSGPTAFAFSILFPSSVLSLSILGCAPVNSMPSQLDALMELLEGWLQKDDEEALFDSMNAILDLAFTASSRPGDDHLRDWLSSMWFKRLGPHQAKTCFVATAPILLSPEITPEEMASIKCPVLLVQGNDDLMQGLPFARDIFDSLKGTTDKSLETVEGGVCYVGIANSTESGPLLTRFLLSHKSCNFVPSSPTTRTRIRFPPPPTPSDPITSLSYSRFNRSHPLVEQLWNLCCQLDGHCFVTFADREREPWEPGGRLEDVSRFRWRFSQRNRNERTLNTSRRGSVPQIRQEKPKTTIIVFENFTILDEYEYYEEEERGEEEDEEEEEDASESTAPSSSTSPDRPHCRRPGKQGLNGRRRQSKEPTVKFSMQDWKWENDRGVGEPSFLSKAEEEPGEAELSIPEHL